MKYKIRKIEYNIVDILVKGLTVYPMHNIVSMTNAHI